MIIKANMANMCAKVTSTYMEFTLAFGPKPEFSFSFKFANFDRNKINNLIEQSIADETFVPGELHKRLLKLHWSDIFTTNYDTLLERTVDMIYRENNYEIIYSQNDLPGSIKPRIIKLHGSIPQVKPYIISDEDYRTYPDKYSALVNTVQQAMLETRLCLLGFSGDDPNFQSWLGWLRDNMGEYCPTIYLIGIYEKLSAPERKLLENKGITIVDISGLVSRQEENRHLNNPVPVSLLSGDRKPQIRFLGNHHSGSGNLYHKSFRM